MEDYELTIETIKHYKSKACEMVRDNCDNCEALHECNNRHWCSFDTVIRFIEYANKHGL